MAIIVSLMAMAWPRIRPMLRRGSHKEAAVQLKADLAQARQLAVETRATWLLKFQPGTGRYTLLPVGQASDLPAEPRELAEGIVFSPLSKDVSDAASSTAFDGNGGRPVDEPRTRYLEHRMSDVVTTQAKGTQEIVEFFPDGRVTETTIRLLRPETGEQIAVRLRGFTGGVTIGDVQNLRKDMPAKALPSDVTERNRVVDRESVAR